MLNNIDIKDENEIGMCECVFFGIKSVDGPEHDLA